MKPQITLLAPKQGCPVLHKPAQASALVPRPFTEGPGLCHTRALAVPSGSAPSPLHASARSHSMDPVRAQEPGTWGVFPPAVGTHVAQPRYKKHLAFCAGAEPSRAGGDSVHTGLLCVPSRQHPGEGPWGALLERLAEFKNQIMHYPRSLGMPGS